MEFRTFPAGTTAHCNRCDLAFPLPKDRDGIQSSDITWRLQQFCTCPHCQMTDCHWVYMRDLAPEPQPQPVTNSGPISEPNLPNDASQPSEPAFPMVDTGEDCPQYTFMPAPEQQLSLL